jgi:hypothetical protein
MFVKELRIRTGQWLGVIMPKASLNGIFVLKRVLDVNI